MHIEDRCWEIMKVCNHNSEWNGRCVVGKISQNYTKSCLTSIVRYGLQGLQNGWRRKKVKVVWNWIERSNTPDKQQTSVRPLGRKNRNCSWCSNDREARKTEFECWEENEIFMVQHLYATFQRTEAWNFEFCLRVRMLLCTVRTLNFFFVLSIRTP